MVRTTKVVCVCALVALVAVPAFGQGGRVAVTADPVYFSCNVHDDEPGLLRLYVVHDLFGSGVTTSSYLVDISQTGWLYLADINRFPLTIGNSMTGVSVSYGDCLAAPIIVQEILVFRPGGTPDCSAVEMLANPASPTGVIEVCDCAGNSLVAIPGRLEVDLNGYCNCVVAKSIPPMGVTKQSNCGAVPVESSTWGGIKSMYRD